MSDHGDVNYDEDTIPVAVDLRVTRPQAPRSLGKLVCLVGGEVGRVHVLDRLPVVIGRAPDAQIVLQGVDVSRYHARISAHEDGLVVEDLGSRNGTAVNGVPVTKARQVVAIGDRLQIGNVVFIHGHHDELEERAQRLQRLESLGQLAGGLAHDFNNLLTVILGGLEFLDEWSAENQVRDPELFKVLAEIKGATGNATELTRRLLDFARREVVREEHPIEVAALVDEIVSMVGRTVRETITIEVDVGAQLQVRGNRSELQQVLLNLCFNARDAMPSGGRLTIQARPRTFSVAQAAAMHVPEEGSYIELQVSDTGTGMDPSTLARAFEPFFTTKPAGEGTGLGLSTVYGIIRNHGGTVLVDSRIGQGTCFRMYLRAAGAATVSAATTTSATTTVSVSVPTPAAGRSAIDRPARPLALVVDDVLASRETTARLLRSLGFETCELDGGRAAVSRFKTDRDQVALVVLDRMMPGMDGDQTLQELRRIDHRVKVLMISGGAAEEAARRGGADGFLRKPFSVDSVRAILGQLGVVATT